MQKASEYWENQASTGRDILPICGIRGVVSFKSKRNLTSRRLRRDARNMRRSLTTPAEDSSVIEILDRILDHGIVLDPSSRMRLPGLDLDNEQERVVIDWRKTVL